MSTEDPVVPRKTEKALMSAWIASMPYTGYADDDVPDVQDPDDDEASD